MSATHVLQIEGVDLARLATIGGELGVAAALHVCPGDDLAVFGDDGSFIVGEARDVDDSSSVTGYVSVHLAAGARGPFRP